MTFTLESPAEALAPPLQALADEKRLRILESLRQGERCVCRLNEALNLPQPLLSHHLRVLRKSGLIVGRREGRWVYYSLVPERLAELEGFLSTLRQDAESARGEADECA